MMSRLFLSLLLFLAWASPKGGKASALPSLPSPQPQVSLQEEGLILEWNLPAAEVSLKTDQQVHVSVPGFDLDNQPGAPLLPYQSLLVALPPGAEPTLELLQTEEHRLDMNGPLALAPLTNELAALEGEADLNSFAKIPVPGDDPIRLETLGVMRGVLLARIDFRPVLSAGNQLRIMDRVSLSVDFNAPLQPTITGQDRGLDLLRQMVINPDQLQVASRETYDPELKSLSFESYSSTAAATDSLMIQVSEAGMIQVSYEDLSARGLPVQNLDPRYLHLTRLGQEVVFDWDGDTDGVFEPGERLLFYAPPFFNRWSDFDVYRLVQTAQPRLHLSTTSAVPDGLLPSAAPVISQTFERNLIYMPDAMPGFTPASKDGDRWVWQGISRPGSSSFEVPFDLSSIDPSKPGRLEIWAFGYTNTVKDPDHNLEIKVNNHTLGFHQWDGKTAAHVEYPLPENLLSVSNTLNLSLPQLNDVAVDGVWLDAFRLHYAPASETTWDALTFQGENVPSRYQLKLSTTKNVRLYDVTNPQTPSRLTDSTLVDHSLGFSDPDGFTGREYALVTEDGLNSPADIRSAHLMNAPLVAGADQIIIAPGEFRPALAPLVALRQSQGLQVVIEDLEAIYDAYGHGLPTPNAIHLYLKNAYQTWNPKPLYVLLVGDGTSDPRQYKSSSSATILPPFLANVDPWLGETAADNRFVAVDGDDLLPDMLIGRLPVNSLEETQAVVNKIVGYEANAAQGGWTGDWLFVADEADQDGSVSYELYADYPEQLESLIDLYPESEFSPYRLYHSDLTTQQLRSSLFDRWNAGAGVIFYHGHASFHQWGEEVYLHINDLPQLTNASKLPILLELTCFTGSFHYPKTPTLDESLLRKPDGGIVAAWGSTGLGITLGQLELAEGFMDHILNDPQATLGSASWAGKLNLLKDRPTNAYLVDTFTLLGDPAAQVRIHYETDFSIFLPAIQR